MLGELKVPGFSTYLHPLSGKRLIGIGFDALEQGSFALFQGIQVSLFDVSNPLEMRRLDNNILGSRGSSSEITWNHHAFFYDDETQILGVPIVEMSEGRTGVYSGESTFSGAQMYRVGTGSLERLARISHYEMIPGYCKGLLASGRWWDQIARSWDINRIFKVDGKILAISPFGVSERLTNDLDRETHRLKLPEPKCSGYELE
jgi:hypothetical protein